MKRIVYLLMLLFLVSCAKHSTPKKVNRILTKGKWQITTFVENGYDISHSYKEVSLSFGKGGDVVTTSESGVSGEWYVGSNKKPAIVYISLPDIDSMNVISGDWAVVKLTRKECILKRNRGLTNQEEKIDYEQYSDNLTLIKN
ncbi:MAG: hypothetical protein HYU67_09350 [Flavobacteriia bacterium]|nr:hypothetical protein [Flavobacteriia bacterium]